jgi:hypothetical protein
MIAGFSIREGPTILVTVNQHPPVHREGWMINVQETVFCCVPVPQLLFFYYLPTNNPPSSRLFLGFLSR